MGKLLRTFSQSSRLPSLSNTPQTLTPSGSKHGEKGSKKGVIEGIMLVSTIEESLYLEALAKKKLQALQLDDRHVTFDKVFVRNYVMTIGDNPSCSVVPPIGISNEYEEEVEESVDDWEKERGAPRTLQQMYIPAPLRYGIIKKSGASRREVASAIRSVNATKYRRIQTTNNMNLYKFEVGLESAKRKMKRLICMRKSDHDEWEEWKSEFEKLTRNNSIDAQSIASQTEVISLEAAERYSDDTLPLVSDDNISKVSTTKIVKESEPIIMFQDES